MTKPEWRENYPCFLVMPQCRDGKLWMNQPWSEKEFKPLDEEPNAQMAMAISILEASLKNPHVDRSRVYLTGLSMGGFGSWELACDARNCLRRSLPSAAEGTNRRPIA